MKELHIIYDPYRVHTTVRFHEDGRWTDMDASSRLSWISDRRMQCWLDPDRRRNSWRGFFAEALEVSGEDELRLLFSGTSEDYQDLCSAARDFDQPGKRIEIAAFSQIEGNDSASKLRLLQERIRSGRKSQFYSLLPDTVQAPLNAALTELEAKPVLVALPVDDPASLQELIRQRSWDIVVFELLEPSMKTPLCRRQLIELATGIGQGREVYRERYFFACVCKDQEERRTLDAARELFLECGLWDTNLFTATAEELRAAVSDQMALGGSAGKEEGLCAQTRRYYSRYAPQIRLESLCEEVSDAAVESGILSRDFRGKIGVALDKANAAVAGSESAGFDYLSRLSEHLGSWNYVGEMVELQNQLSTRAAQEVQTGLEQFLPSSARKEKHPQIRPEDLVYFVSRIFDDSQRFLSGHCQYAVNEIEKRWGSVYMEYVSEYLQAEERPAYEIPDALIAKGVPPPQDSVSRALLESECEKAVADGLIPAEDALQRCRKQILQAFLDWLKKYGRALTACVDEVRAGIAEYADGTDGNAYREQVKLESAVRDQAVRWLKDFISDVDHLLDIEAEVAEDVPEDAG